MAFPLATTATDGVTVANKAWVDAFVAEINAALVDAGHPTVTPATIIAELIAARGSMPSLNARLLGVVSASGANLATIQPQQLRNGYVWGNCAWNAGHVMWSRGDAAAPDGWTMSGVGNAVARCGSGLADTNVLSAIDTRNFSAKVTCAGAIARMTQEFLPAAAFGMSDTAFWEHDPPVDANAALLPGFLGDELPSVYVIAAVYSNGTSRARISIGDNAAAGSNLLYSNYHPGDATWRWILAGPFNVNASPASLNIQGHCETVGSAYFMHWMICPSTIGLPPMFLPEKPVTRTHTFPIIASPVAATGYGYFVPNRPVFITGIRAYVAGVAPTGGTTLKLDLMTPIGGAYASLFGTVPAFVASDLYALKVPDPAAANYRRRCIRGVTAAGAALADNSVLRLDVNTRDSGNTATNVVVEVDYLEFPRPFEQWRIQTDLGE